MWKEEFTEFDEWIRPRGCVDLVAELGVELLREVLEEGVGQLLVEVSITQGQEARVLLDYVTEKNW